MELLTIFLISLGLSVDSFAVSVSSGLMVNNIQFKQAVRIALFLSIFQALFPLLGWIAGKEVKIYIELYDHWVAFSLLAFLGIRMIINSMRKSKKRSFNPLKFEVMVMMSFATSLDALAVGFSFALVEIPILIACLIIGITTFIAAMLGMLLGKKVKKDIDKVFEVVGGVILLLIGIKILFEHLS